MRLVIRNYIEPSGQRNATIVNSETGLPEFWPTLYASSQLRARGNAHSTLKSHLLAIIYLYRWASIRNIDLEARIISLKGFSINEVDSLVTLLRSRISELPPSSSSSSNIVKIDSARKKPLNVWKALEEQPRQITPSTFNDRLDYIGRYIAWLCDYLSDQNERASSEHRESVTETGVWFRKALFNMKSVEPNTTFSKSKTISNADIRIILESISPISPLNPWQGIETRIRNFAIVYALLDTGLRSGELLSLKLKDIIHAKKDAKGLKVVRRQGAKDDPRINQPSSKRNEREVPLSESAFKALDLYVTSVRNKIPQAAQTDYLFISLSNNQRGMPLSSLGAITDMIRNETGINLTPHKLRHTATWRYCTIQKKQGRKWDEFVEQLILKFGWSSEKSPSVRHYAKQFIKDQMFEAAIREQDELNGEMLTVLKDVKQGLEYEQY
jgi:integrase